MSSYGKANPTSRIIRQHSQFDFTFSREYVSFPSVLSSHSNYDDQLTIIYVSEIS